MSDEAGARDETPNVLNVDTRCLRQLCLEWIETREFMEYFWEIHPGIFFRMIAASMATFRSDLRGYGRRRGRSSPELMAHYRTSVRSAPIVFSHVVMANTALLHEGISSPALVVVASGPGSDETMARASSVLARVHFGDVRSREEEVLAGEIEDEDYQFGRRRALPGWLVGEREAYAADLWVPGKAAHAGGLRSNVLPCFAEPGSKGLTFAIPQEFVEKSIRGASRPPVRG